MENRKSNPDWFELNTKVAWQTPRRTNSQGNIMSYVGHYLIPILDDNTYLLILIPFLHCLVPQAPHTYGVSGSPQALTNKTNNPACLCVRKLIFHPKPLLSYLMMLIFEKAKWTGNAIPCRKVVEFRPQL